MSELEKQVDSIEEIADKGLEQVEIANNIEKDDKKRTKKTNKMKRKLMVRNILIGVLIVIIILLLLKTFLPKKEDPKPNNETKLELEDGDYVEKTTPEVDVQNIDLPVISDFTVTEDYPYVNFCNPETNKDFYLQYEIYLNSNEELIYQSKFVDTGKKFSVNLRKELGVGIYDAYIKVRTFEKESLNECNGIKTNVVITVE